MAHFYILSNLGAIAYLLPPEENFEYHFTLIEIYGGAQLTFARNRTIVHSLDVTGDDTGYLHVAPHHVLDMNGVREGRGNQTIVHSLDVTGDDTGYLHVAPHHVLDMNGEERGGGIEP